MDLGGPRVSRSLPRIDWNAQLPYLALSSSRLFPSATPENETCDSLLRDICSGLVAAAEEGDWFGGRLESDARVGVIGWTTRLQGYLQLKLPLPHAQRIGLINFYYSLLSLPAGRNPVPLSTDPITEASTVAGPEICEFTSRLDPNVLDTVLSMLARLLRKGKRLKDAAENGEIPSPALSLDWKVLWRLWRTLVHFKSRDKSPPAESKPLSNLLGVIELARPFFTDPLRARKEMLDELLPLFDSEFGVSSGLAWNALGALLPSEYPPSSSSSDEFDHIPLLLATYLSAGASPLPPASILTLLSRTARDNIASPIRPGFTSSQIRAVVANALGMGGVVEIPGAGRRGIGSVLQAMGLSSLSGPLSEALGKLKGDSVRHLAGFLVWTCFPPPFSSSDDDRVPQTGVPELIEDIMSALDTYFHPSNTGKWTSGLVRFARELIDGFLERFREEQSPGCKTPERFRLTEEVLQRICAAVRPPLLLAVYGKDMGTVHVAHQAVKLLCWIDPQGTFPPVLDRIYGSLESAEGTTVHRTQSSISLLAQIFPPLLNRRNYPPGAQHLVPLLNGVLPGIDMNDPNKTRASLVAVLTGIVGVAVVDATASIDAKPPRWRRNGGIVHGPGSVAQEEGDSRMDDVDYDDEARSQTAGFADWVAALLDRAFLMLENLPQGFGSGGGGAEDQVMGMLMPTIGVVINHASPEIQDLAIRKVVAYATTHCIPNATKPMGRLASAVGGYDPSRALDNWLPLCLSKIKEELAHGASGRAVAANAEPPGSDGPLHWWQCIAYNAVQQIPSAEVLRHRPVLEELLEVSLAGCKSDRGFRYAGKLVKRILKSLVDVFPLESRPWAPEKWEEKGFLKGHTGRWGETTDPHDLQVEWNVPDDAEKEFSLEVAEKWAGRAAARLLEIRGQVESAVEGLDTRDVSNELIKWLLVIKNVLGGMQSMFLEPDVPGSPRRRVAAGYAFTDPADPRFVRAKTLRENIGKLLHETSTFLCAKREDDIEAFKVLTKVIGVFICDSSLNPKRYDQVSRSYNWYKSLVRTPGDHHRLPRWVLVMRLYAQHLMRLRRNTRNLPRSPLITALLDDLVALSLSRYAQVRQFAQAFLDVGLRTFPAATYELAPRILDVLESLQTRPGAGSLDDVEADRLKGALHLLHSDRFLRACLADPALQKRLMIGLVKAQAAEKPSLQDLIRQIFLDSIGAYPEASLRSVRGASVLAGGSGENLLQICNAKMDPTMSERIATGVSALDASRVESYEATLASLIEAAAAPATHWRYRTMSLNFIDVLLRDDFPVPASLAQLIVSGIVSDILHVRRVCVGLLTRTLLILKKRAGVLAGGTSISKAVKRRVFKPHAEAEAEAGVTLYLDRTSTGWFCWPASYRVYSEGPEIAPGSLPYLDPTSTEAFQIIRTALTSSAFWTAHMDFVSQEATSRNGVDAAFELFDVQAAKMYKSVFATFQDSILDVVRPILESYCALAAEKSKQRAASELSSGLIRGMKHWSSAKQSATWSWLAPLLMSTIMSCGPEAMGYWTTSLVSALRNRDPRRASVLVDALLSLRPDPTSESFQNESKKVSLLQSAFACFTHRLPRDQTLHILDGLLANLRNPYERVRDLIGQTINDVLQGIWVPGFGTPGEAIRVFAERGDGGVQGMFPVEADVGVLEMIERVLKDLEAWRVEGERERAGNPTAITAYGLAGKTLSVWLSDAVSGGKLQGTLPYIHRGLLKEVLAMSDFPEPEVAKAAQGVLAGYGTLPQPPCTLKTGLEILTDTLNTSSSWHLRQLILPVLQVTYFRHLFYLDAALGDRVMQTVAGLLSDPQIEVRQLAGRTLSGLVRCSQRDSIDSLKSRFEGILRRTKIPNRPRGPNANAGPPSAEYNEAILKRHSAILGLSSLVSCFPYELPPFVPSALLTLAKCLDDPAPINASVKAVFAEFKRTHQDTWHEDREKFLAEELEELSGALGGATYYV